MTPTGEAPEPRMLRRTSSALHKDIRASIDGERGTIGKTGRGETGLRLATASGGPNSEKGRQPNQPNDVHGEEASVGECQTPH